MFMSEIHKWLDWDYYYYSGGLGDGGTPWFRTLMCRLVNMVFLLLAYVGEAIPSRNGNGCCGLMRIDTGALWAGGS